MPAKSALAALAAVTVLTACGDATRTYRNVLTAPRISAEAVAAYNRDHVEAIRTLRTVVRTAEAGAAPAADGPIPVVDLPAAREAAFAFVDASCDDYLKALFATNRARVGVNRSLVATGAATTTILGLAGAATAPIGIVAAGFGLGSSLLDAAGAALLYELDPASVSELVVRERAAYRGAGTLQPPPTSEGMLLAQVQGYVRICTPMAIEARVNDAIRAARVEETPARSAPAPTGEPAPTVETAPGVPLLRVAPAAN